MNVLLYKFFCFNLKAYSETQNKSISTRNLNKIRKILKCPTFLNKSGLIETNLYS